MDVHQHMCTYRCTEMQSQHPSLSIHGVSRSGHDQDVPMHVVAIKTCPCMLSRSRRAHACCHDQDVPMHVVAIKTCPCMLSRSRRAHACCHDQDVPMHVVTIKTCPCMFTHIYACLCLACIVAYLHHVKTVLFCRVGFEPCCLPESLARARHLINWTLQQVAAP
jgi:hypothetical protein